MLGGDPLTRQVVDERPDESGRSSVVVVVGLDAPPPFADEHPRVLHALRGHVAVWPIDPLPASGPVLAEIYTSIAALAAGRTAATAKIKTREELDTALLALGSPPLGGKGKIDDHSSDALLTAAWMRANAHRAQFWSPGGMTPAIARTEGWTFGVP